MILREFSWVIYVVENGVGCRKTSEQIVPLAPFCCFIVSLRMKRGRPILTCWTDGRAILQIFDSAPTDLVDLKNATHEHSKPNVDAW